MVQSEIYWIRNGGPFDISQKPVVDIFNSYFGGGMGSVVFQTIRESKALAYSTFASYTEPAKKEDPFLAIAYIGCQADKMKEAVSGMNALLDTMPVSPNNFELAKSGMKKDFQTERITGDGIIFSYLAARQKGIDFDARKKEYESIDQVSVNDIRQLHDRELSARPYAYCIVGSAKKIDLDDLKKIGEVKNLSLEEIFGY
jgi:predicted Zn-dependent peptidase